MSMIARYKKKGGFLQLLNLIETCGPQKQEKFLKMIEDEDLRWADAVRMKLLTVKKIFSWNDNAVAELAAALKDLTLATTICGLDEPSKEKVYKMMNHSRKRKIEDLIEEKKPNPAEVSTAFMQVITEVRKMIQDGLLVLEKIDPNLMISSDFEDGLLSGMAIVSSEPRESKPTPVQATPAATHEAPAPQHNHDHGDVEHLKRTISQLTIENQKLKERLVQMEAKLNQIKKIA